MIILFCGSSTLFLAWRTQMTQIYNDMSLAGISNPFEQICIVETLRATSLHENH